MEFGPAFRPLGNLTWRYHLRRCADLSTLKDDIQVQCTVKQGGSLKKKKLCHPYAVKQTNALKLSDHLPVNHFYEAITCH